MGKQVSKTNLPTFSFVLIIDQSKFSLIANINTGLAIFSLDR